MMLQMNAGISYNKAYKWCAGKRGILIQYISDYNSNDYYNSCKFYLIQNSELIKSVRFSKYYLRNFESQIVIKSTDQSADQSIIQ